MQGPFYESTPDEPVVIGVQPTPIRPAAQAATLVPATVSAATGYLQSGGNPARNNRLNRALPAGQWKVRWTADLGIDARPTAVLTCGDRIMVQHEKAWDLFAEGGKRITGAALTPGELWIDPAEKLFLHPGNGGVILARKLADASLAWQFFTEAPGAFHRSVLTRDDGRVLIEGHEMPQMATIQRIPDVTLFEVQDLGDMKQLGPENMLSGAVPAAKLTTRLRPLLAAFSADRLAMAATDHVYLADRNLKIVADLQDRFVPLAMALDEAARTYLVVAVDDRRFLWVIAPDGQRLLSYELPAAMQMLTTRPAIGYDHRTYLAGEGRLLCVGIDGKLLWEQPSAGKFGGMNICSDGALLVAAGNELSRIDAGGKRTVLSTLPDAITTPPVLAENDELFVAAGRKLYCLKTDGVK